MVQEINNGAAIFVTGTMGSSAEILISSGVSTSGVLLPPGFFEADMGLGMARKFLPFVLDGELVQWDRRVLWVKESLASPTKSLKRLNQKLKPKVDAISLSWSQFERNYDPRCGVKPMVWTDETPPPWASRTLDIEQTPDTTLYTQTRALSKVGRKGEWVILTPSMCDTTYFVGDFADWDSFTQNYYLCLLGEKKAVVLSEDEMAEKLITMSKSRSLSFGDTLDGVRIDSKDKIKTAVKAGYHVRATEILDLIRKVSPERAQQLLTTNSSMIKGTLRDVGSWYDVQIEVPSAFSKKRVDIAGVPVGYGLDQSIEPGTRLTAEQVQKMVRMSHNPNTPDLGAGRLIQKRLASGSMSYLKKAWEICQALDGLAIVVGPKGSGKSTMAALLSMTVSIECVDSDEYGDSDEFRELHQGRSLNEMFKDLYYEESAVAARLWLRNLIASTEYRNIMRAVVERRFGGDQVWERKLLFCHTRSEAEFLSGAFQPRQKEGLRAGIFTLHNTGLRVPRIENCEPSRAMASIYNQGTISTTYVYLSDFVAAARIRFAESLVSVNSMTPSDELCLPSTSDEE